MYRLEERRIDPVYVAVEEWNADAERWVVSRTREFFIAFAFGLAVGVVVMGVVG